MWVPWPPSPHGLSKEPRSVTWVLAVGAQSAEAGVAQSPQLVVLEGPGQPGHQLLQGDALGTGHLDENRRPREL